MSVNILDQNGNLKKIAHGFSESKFNTFRSDVISNIEMTDTASKDYAVGDFLIMANGQLAQVTSTIYQDMTINLSNVRLTTVEEMIAAKADPADIPDVSKYQKIFTGTMSEWNQLTTEQKTAYDLANITDDLGTEADIVDAVTDGDMRAVTSNAVHDALEFKADKAAISSVETTNTAVSAHAVGSYFINASGQFVKATSAIAIGDTIIVKPTVGYNCEVTTIAEVLEAANNSIISITTRVNASQIAQNNRVNISDYNAANNIYTATSDGYLYLYADSTRPNSMVNIVNNDGTVGMQVSAIYTNSTAAGNVVFVKKGLRMYKLSGTGVALFYPIS